MLLLLQLLLLLPSGLVELLLLWLGLGLEGVLHRLLNWLHVGGLGIGGGEGRLDVAGLDRGSGGHEGRGVRFRLRLESWNRLLEGGGGGILEDHRVRVLEAGW